MNTQNPMEAYKERQLPGDRGITVESEKGNNKNFIPKEALVNSDRARNPKALQENLIKKDLYSEERVSKDQPVVDSSEETLGG